MYIRPYPASQTPPLPLWRVTHRPRLVVSFNLEWYFYTGRRNKYHGRQYAVLTPTGFLDHSMALATQALLLPRGQDQAGGLVHIEGFANFARHSTPVQRL